MCGPGPKVPPRRYDLVFAFSGDQVTTVNDLGWQCPTVIAEEVLEHQIKIEHELCARGNAIRIEWDELLGRFDSSFRATEVLLVLFSNWCYTIHRHDQRSLCAIHRRHTCNFLLDTVDDLLLNDLGGNSRIAFRWFGNNLRFDLVDDRVKIKTESANCLRDSLESVTILSLEPVRPKTENPHIFLVGIFP